jgi:hypothetical protein
MVLLSALHSMVEYPLWYAYFLLPTALAWGLALGGAAPGPRPARPAPANPAAPAGPTASGAAGSLSGVALGALMLFGGAYAVRDYLNVVEIYAPAAAAGPLAQRIAQGQRSLLFAHHADYAAATNPSSDAARALAFARAPHSLMDTRLMLNWASYLNEQGQADQARWLAARLREFNRLALHPDAAAFFEPCKRAPAEAQPFQCQPPQQQHHWRSFLSPGQR